MRVGGQPQALAVLRFGKIPGTSLTGGWVGPRAGLGECGKPPSHRYSIHGPPSLKLVGELTALSQPTVEV